MKRTAAAVARIVVIGVLTALAAPAGAQPIYPNKPIRFIVPFPTGGSTDPLARLVGQKLVEIWGQQVLVDNRPGGNTVIGTEAVAKSPPDGYTILLAATSHVTNPLLVRAPFDAIKDFAPVATLTSTELILVLHPSVPANNLREFIALAKSRPGQLNFASAGTGNPNHLAAELLNMMAGIKLQHIPYKGAGPAVTDLIGGQVQLFFATPIAVISFIKSGKLKVIASTRETRSPALPQVPTFAEAGLPGFDVKIWYGVVAPAGTPKDVIAKLAIELNKIVAMPDVKEKLESQGMNPFTTTTEQFAALMKADMERYAKIIKTANIKLDN